MNWNKGFSAEYYASVVDPSTWRDIERFEIIDGDINRKSSDLMESASISVMKYDRGEIWVRIWLDVRQAGASEHLQKYLLAREETHDILFCNRLHEKMKPGGIRFILKSIGKRAGVEDVHPHRFRRTFATNLSKRGMDIQEIRKLLGHSNINTTLEYIYTDDSKVHASYRQYTA